MRNKLLKINRYSPINDKYELIHNFLIYDSNKIYLEIDLNLGVSGSVIMFKEVER